MKDIKMKKQKDWYEDWEYFILPHVVKSYIREDGNEIDQFTSSYLLLCLPNSRTKKLFVVESHAPEDDIEELFNIATSALTEVSKLSSKKKGKQ